MQRISALAIRHLDEERPGRAAAPAVAEVCPPDAGIAQAELDERAALRAGRGVDPPLTAQDPAFANEIVNIALTSELPSGRVDRFLGAAAAANAGSDALWQAMLRNRHALMQKLTTGQKERLFAGVARAFSDALDHALLRADIRVPGRYQRLALST